MNAYLWIDISLLLIPLLFYSLNKKNRIYKSRKPFIYSLLISLTLFCIGDCLLIQSGTILFNLEKISFISNFPIPLERVVFLFALPYFFIFLYETIQSNFKKNRPLRFTYIFSLIFTLSALTLSYIFRDFYYTFLMIGIAGVLNWIIYFGYTPKWYPTFILSFLIGIAPFILLDNIIYGAFGDAPYIVLNKSEAIGTQIGQAPLETLYYNFILCLVVVLFYEFFKSRKQRTVKNGNS